MTTDTDEVRDYAALWPDSYGAPDDLARIECTPIKDRDLPRTTYEVLVRGAAQWPDRPALSVMPDGARWRETVATTFAELLARVHRFANGLHRLGVRRRDPVALMSPNCDGLIVATLAAQLAGTAIPINGSLRSSHIRKLIGLSGARVLIAAGPDLDPSTWQACQEVALAGIIDVVVVLDPTGAAATRPLTLTGAEVIRLVDLAEGVPAETFVGEPPTAEDLAALFHTGGTTGLPKLAAHTHRNEVSDAWMLAASTLMGDRDTVLAALPLFHVNALVVTLVAPLMRGQHSLWAGPLGFRDPDLMSNFWTIMSGHGVNAMSAVPTVYGALARTEVGDADISNFRLAIVGASPLPIGVRTAFEAVAGVPLVEGYGLTEAACASAKGFPGQTPAGAVGQRLAYQQIKAVEIGQDDTWHDLPPGSIGIIAIAGPTVFPGYVVGRDHDGLVLDGRGRLRDGWLNTGDLGLVDGEGFLHLTGRAKDLIIRGGHNIDPRIVENALLEHPHVTGASVVGQPDRHAGEVPVAYVTLDATVAEQDLVAWAADHVSERAAAPKEVRILNELPVTGVGKPYKLGLRADAARRAVHAALGELVRPEAVTADVEDGSIVVAIALPPGLEEETVQARLDHFSVSCRTFSDSTG